MSLNAGKEKSHPKKTSQKGHFWLVGRRISCDFALLELQRTSCNNMKVLVHPFLFSKILNHPLETTIYRWMFQVGFHVGQFPNWATELLPGHRMAPEWQGWCFWKLARQYLGETETKVGWKSWKKNTPQKSGSTISTNRYMRKSNLKIERYCFFGDAGFLPFFRVVSSDYGKPRKWIWMFPKIGVLRNHRF